MKNGINISSFIIIFYFHHLHSLQHDSYATLSGINHHTKNLFTCLIFYLLFNKEHIWEICAYFIKMNAWKEKRTWPNEWDFQSASVSFQLLHSQPVKQNSMKARTENKVAFQGNYSLYTIYTGFAFTTALELFTKC